MHYLKIDYLTEDSTVDVTRGKSGSVNCSSNIKPMWFFERHESRPMSAPLAVRENRFVIAPYIHWNHGGNYFCYGSGDYGASHFLSISKLKVSRKPEA